MLEQEGRIINSVMKMMIVLLLFLQKQNL